MELDPANSTHNISGWKSNQKNDTAEKQLNLEDILQDIPFHRVSPSLNGNCAHKDGETVKATVQGLSPAHTHAEASFQSGLMTQPAYIAAQGKTLAQLGAQALLSLQQTVGSGCSSAGERIHCRPASKIDSDAATEGHESDGGDDLVAMLFPETTRSSAGRDPVAARTSPRAMTKQQSSSAAASEKPPTSHMHPGRSSDRLKTLQRTYTSPTAGLKGSRGNGAAERKSRATCQRHKVGSTRQASLESGFAPGDSDLEDILNLPSSSQSGESNCSMSALSAACATGGNGNNLSTSRWNISAVVRQEDGTRSNAESVVPAGRRTARTPTRPLTNTMFPATPACRDEVGRSTILTSDPPSGRVELGAPDTTCQANTSETAAAAAHGAQATAAEIAVTAAGGEAAAMVATERATALEAQLELLRTENQALHTDNRRLHRRLQTDIQATEATSQRKLLGERAEWQSERDKYEGRLRMLETDLDRLRDQQTQDGKTFEEAMRTFEEQRRLLETEQEKKYSRLLKAAVEKEKYSCEAILREKTAQYSLEVKQTERRCKQQMEEQKKLFEDRVEAHKQQVNAQRELYGLMEHVKSSAASIEQLTERLATQTVHGNETLSTQMAQRDGALQEIEQRLREQQNQAAKQHSALVTLAADFRKQQKAAEDSLAKERERLDAERAEVMKLRHMLHAAEEEQRKAFDELHTRFQGEKERCLLQQNEKEADHARREQRLKLLERHLRREKQTLEEQTRSLEETRARATARLHDLENEVSEERRQLIQERDTARSGHLQLLQMRQEIEFKQARLEAQQIHVQEEKRKLEGLLERIQLESAEVKQLHAEATEARASIDSRGRHLDQKQVKCSAHMEQLQSVFKLVQKERLKLLRHESRLLGAGAVVGTRLEAKSRVMADGPSLVEHQLSGLVGVSTPFSAPQEGDHATAALLTDPRAPPRVERKGELQSATVLPQRQRDLQAWKAHESGISLKTRSRDAFADGPHVKTRICAALQPADRPSTVESIAFTPVSFSGKVLWRVRPPARAVERDCLTSRTARLSGVCAGPWEASWTPKRHSAATSSTSVNSTPAERPVFCEQWSHVVEKPQGHLNVRAPQEGLHCMWLSDSGSNGRQVCPALSNSSCSTGLSASARPSWPDSAGCYAEERFTARNCAGGSRRSMSAVVIGAHRRKQAREAAAHTCGSLPKTVRHPESPLYRQSEPLQHGGQNGLGGGGRSSSTGICHEGFGQCRGGDIYSDSLRAHRAPRTSHDQPVTNSQGHNERATTDAASVHDFEKHTDTQSRLSWTPSTKSLSQKDSLKTSYTSMPAVDGEKQALPDCNASTSSILSLKSLPT